MKKVLLLSAGLFLLINISASAKNLAPGDTNKTDAHGKKQGFWKESEVNNDFYGDYVDNKKEGQWIGYYSQGQLSNIYEYRNGMKNGYCFAFEKIGFISLKEHYVNDTLDGRVTNYFQAGRAKSETDYKKLPDYKRSRN